MYVKCAIHGFGMTLMISLDAALPYSMKAAAFNGLLSSNLLSLPSPPFNCPTANCTWNPFSTLAIGVECKNITNRVSLNCTTPSAADPGAEFCNLISLEDATLQKLLNKSDPNVAFYIEAGLDTSYLSELESFANMTGFLSMVQWVRAPGRGTPIRNQTMATTLNQTASFEAGRCGLYFSVQQLQAQVNNGVYSEEVLQEYTRSEQMPTIPTWTLNATGVYNMDPNATGTKFYFQDVYQYNTSNTLVYKPTFGQTIHTSENTFNVTFNIFAMLQSLISTSSFLNGIVGVGYSSGALGSGTDGTSINENVLLLYEADNITRAVQNLAYYMTTEIRGVDSEFLQQKQGNVSIVAANQAIMGTSWIQKQFVVVQWTWLVLPALLLISANCLFVATCLKTKNSRIGLWQSSPLTLFFHGKLRGNLQDFEPSELNTAGKMGKAAAGFHAQVMKDSHGTIEVYRKVETDAGD
jgi:hypothetical protein